MSYISQYIQKINSQNRKVFTAFMTAGFPDKKQCLDYSIDILNAGADMFELGIPFSDPIADGPTIQAASHRALKNGTTMHDVFTLAEKIKTKTGKPLLLMGYANPIHKFGIGEFARQAVESGVDGLIIPDIPLEEFNSFINSDLNMLDVVLLTTPASSEKRIEEVDRKSSGFVYCVSVNGTTGQEGIFTQEVVANIDRTYKTITRNKMMVGFGISSASDVKKIKSSCDGVIVASSIIKKINAGYDRKKIINYVEELSNACND